MRKRIEGAAGACGVSPGPCQVGKLRQGAAWLSPSTPPPPLSAGDGCGHTLLTPHSGTLSSKNYPGTYPNHTACRWRLRTPPGTSLLLAFGDVDLEPSEHCARSSLLLADPQAGPYCRNAGPAAPLLVTNSSAVTVLFNSTSHRSGRGLLLSYATSQHPDLVSCLVRGTHYTQEHVSVYCPAGCKDIDGDIWGNPSQGYRDTSVLCKAAVHAGVIADELGGQVTLSRQKGITLYESTFANGLHSKRWVRACGDVLEVAAFNASSWWHEVDALGQDRAWVAQRAALGTAGHSWAAEPGSEAAWLELDLGTRRNVTGIITKGSSEQYNYYVTSYRVSSSRDGKNWRPYRGSGGQEDKVFEGNTDSHGEVSNAFIPPIVARYVRVTPQRWHQRVALKVALVGCQLARVRAPRPYGEPLGPFPPGDLLLPTQAVRVPHPWSPLCPAVPSIPREVSVPTSRPAGHTPIPGIALDPEKAGGCHGGGGGCCPWGAASSCGCSRHQWTHSGFKIPVRDNSLAPMGDAALPPQAPRCWWCCSSAALCSSAPASCCWLSSAAGRGGSPSCPLLRSRGPHITSPKHGGSIQQLAGSPPTPSRCEEVGGGSWDPSPHLALPLAESQRWS
uniref:Discoidin, CUB and LCCL domain containing 1 n=1 Tax=Strix occidentalis caurina TaxID=311401 RepID=A0A8D0EQ07_STROC